MASRFSPRFRTKTKNKHVMFLSPKTSGPENKRKSPAETLFLNF